MEIYTIGFSKKNLRHFVDLLEENKIEKLIDTRLNNTSQLSGYSKKDDLAYVMELRNIDYTHEITLAPTESILKSFKKKEISWAEYENQYIKLLEERNILKKIEDIISDKRVCFLCSEHEPKYCHRRLLVEYLQEKFKSFKVVHLM